MFDQTCTVVAEVAQAHDGSLGLAHSYIDAAADAGAGAVKFQTHIAEAESTPDEPWRIRFSPQDETRYEYWKRMEFTLNQWIELGKHAKEKGLLFISSPFSSEAVELLVAADVDVLKIASGEVGNLPMLGQIADTGMPVILSSGMSPWSELDEAVETLGAGANSHLAVLQCTSEYPCPPESLGLNVITELRDRYQLPVGLSDHSGTIYPGLAAATLGANVLEVHVTFSRSMFGPDVPASITFAELAQLTEGVRVIEAAMRAPVDKEAIAERMAPLRATFTKSIVAKRDLEVGAILTEGDIAFRKPGTGIPPGKANTVLGSRLAKALSANTQLDWDHLEVPDR